MPLTPLAFLFKKQFRLLIYCSEKEYFKKQEKITEDLFKEKI